MAKSKQSKKERIEDIEDAVEYLYKVLPDINGRAADAIKIANGVGTDLAGIEIQALRSTTLDVRAATVFNLIEAHGGNVPNASALVDEADILANYILNGSKKDEEDDEVPGLHEALQLVEGNITVEDLQEARTALKILSQGHGVGSGAIPSGAQLFLAALAKTIILEEREPETRLKERAPGLFTTDELEATIEPTESFGNLS